MCNKGFHPLHGTFMKGNAYPLKPHCFADLDTGKVTGGIVVDIFSIITGHYGVSFNVTFSKTWVVANDDGSIGGSVGQVGQ